MYHYSIIQWLFFFYLYCFLGWCFESTYVSIRTKRLTNRGFMRGPFLPIYGSGAIMMLVVSMPFQDNIVLTYFAGCLGATVLEYVTGVTMEALFKVRYWDYSNQKFNFQGHICLSSSIAWGFFTILMTEVIHVPIENFVLSIPSRALTIVTVLLSVFIFADFSLSFKAAIDLREILIRMEQAKEEMARLQKRLDVMIAVASEEVGIRKDGFAENLSEIKTGITGNMEELKLSIENKMLTLKNWTKERPGEHAEKSKEELVDIKAKYSAVLERINILGGLRDFFQRDLIRSNPAMTSTKYKDSLEELKNKVLGYKGNHKEAVKEADKVNSEKDNL